MTAFELRIIDWSSDVCPSVLASPRASRHPIHFESVSYHVVIAAADRSMDPVSRGLVLLDFHQPDFQQALQCSNAWRVVSAHPLQLDLQRTRTLEFLEHDHIDS